MSNKILVVDDDELVCDVVERLLLRSGIECTRARDGVKARAIIAEATVPFSAAVVDLVLPHGVSGWDVVSAIRASAVMKAIPILVMTGADISEEEMQKLGKDAVIILKKKDFSIPTFTRTVEQLLRAGKA